MRGTTPPKPIPIKDRASILFVDRGRLDVKDGAFVLVDKNGVRTHIPIGGLACLMLEPGTRVSHSAAVLAGRVGCLLIWCGEAGVRMYAAGQPGGARADRLLYQASLALDPEARLRVVRKMYDLRFGEAAPQRRSIEQLRGIEGARVRNMYKLLANQYGVKWTGRNYDPTEWKSGDLANRCLSQATSCLYGISEAAILAAGYAPAIGFLHTGKSQSFVYDIADIYKFETVVPIAFKIAAVAQENPNVSVESMVRIECRDSFRSTGILRKLIPEIEEILAAGNLPIPSAPPETQEVAFRETKTGDVGHRG